jgi:ATP-dependent helicase/nuclease subunit A
MAENKKPVWTSSQKEAIELRGKNLLVSAAAGSGKTATLTERIIRSLTNTENPADISKMLVVTFTRAAASELRMKISRALAQALCSS